MLQRSMGKLKKDQRSDQHHEGKEEMYIFEHHPHSYDGYSAEGIAECRPDLDSHAAAPALVGGHEAPHKNSKIDAGFEIDGDSDDYVHRMDLHVNWDFDR